MSFTYVLASPAHLYMYQLFTHCLPTIICVMLMSIVSLSFLLFWFIAVGLLLVSFLTILYCFFACSSCICDPKYVHASPTHLHIHHLFFHTLLAHHVTLMFVM